MEENLKCWNGYQLSIQAGVSYDKLAASKRHQSGKNLKPEERENILKAAREAYMYLERLLNEGQAL